MTTCAHRDETLVSRGNHRYNVVTVCGVKAIGVGTGWTSGPVCAAHADEYTYWNGQAAS